MERNKDNEATKTCGDHLKKLLAEKIGRTNKPLTIKVKQSVKDRCVKIKSNDVSNSFKLSVDFKNNKMEFFYDPFKRQNSMKTCRKNSACGKLKKNDSHLVVPEVILQNPDIQPKTEQYTEIHHKIDVSTKLNLNITDTANQKEHEFQINTDKELQLSTNAYITIGDNSLYYTKLRCERKERGKMYGSAVLVGTPERWLTLNAAIHTYSNTEHNGASSLFVNIERTPKRDSVTFWRPVDKLTNEQLLDLCHGALNKTTSSISLNQFKNLNDVSMNISLSTNSGNNVSDQNKFESENKKTTPVQNESTASNYSETIEKKSDITFEQVQAVQEERCRRKKVTSKVKGQTRHVPQKPFYIITTQDEEVVRQLLLDFPLHDFVRKETNIFFRNEQKMHFTRPSVPIPSMHPLLPYKLMYLDGVETLDHHVIETSSAPTEPESQDSDFHQEEEYYI